MSIEECKQIILDNFRSIKLEKDYAQLQLSLFQVEELISHYEKLIDLQEEIQSKFDAFGDNAEQFNSKIQKKLSDFKQYTPD